MMLQDAWGDGLQDLIRAAATRKPVARRKVGGTKMLCRLTKRPRRRAAYALIALYAFCVVGSPLAVAFAGTIAALPCFTGEHHGAAMQPAELAFVSGGHEHHSGDHAHEGVVHHPADHSAPPPNHHDGQHK